MPSGYELIRYIFGTFATLFARNCRCNYASYQSLIAIVKYGAKMRECRWIKAGNINENKTNAKINAKGSRGWKRRIRNREGKYWNTLLALLVKENAFTAIRYVRKIKSFSRKRTMHKNFIAISYWFCFLCLYNCFID